MKRTFWATHEHYQFPGGEVAAIKKSSFVVTDTILTFSFFLYLEYFDFCVATPHRNHRNVSPHLVYKVFRILSTELAREEHRASWKSVRNKSFPLLLGSSWSRTRHKWHPKRKWFLKFYWLLIISSNSNGESRLQKWLASDTTHSTHPVERRESGNNNIRLRKNP